MRHGLTATQEEFLAHAGWREGLLAGVIAGLVFVAMEMGLVWLAMGESPWGPPYMIAAMLLGQDILPSPGTWAPFDLTIFITAVVIHMLLSAVYGVIGAFIFRTSDWTGALLLGAAFGAAIYIINFYVIAPTAFPWFLMGRNWIGAFSHIMFGVVFGIAYLALRKRHMSSSAA